MFPKKLYFFTFYLVTILFTQFIAGCKEKYKENIILPNTTALSISIMPEFNDSTYLLEWKDTLGQSEGYINENKFERPQELTCIVLNSKKDTIGRYNGQSMPCNFTYFTTKEKEIYLYFAVDFNAFTKKNFSEKMSRNSVENYYQQFQLPRRLAPLSLKISKGQRLEIDTVLRFL